MTRPRTHCLSQCFAVPGRRQIQTGSTPVTVVTRLSAPTSPRPLCVTVCKTLSVVVFASIPCLMCGWCWPRPPEATPRLTHVSVICPHTPCTYSYSTLHNTRRHGTAGLAHRILFINQHSLAPASAWPTVQHISTAERCASRAPCQPQPMGRGRARTARSTTSPE